MHENELLMIQPNDNVAVALKALSKGSECSVGGKNIILKDDIPAAHKVALTEIGKDENVIKYGLPIGHAITCTYPQYDNKFGRSSGISVSSGTRSVEELYSTGRSVF